MTAVWVTEVWIGPDGKRKSHPAWICKPVRCNPTEHIRRNLRGTKAESGEPVLIITRLITKSEARDADSGQLPLL